jgi:hypothetical protein
MGRQTDVFVIDGDTVLKTPKPTAVKPGAGAQTVPLAPETRGAAATVSEGGSRNRAVGASSLSMFVWGSGQWLNGDRDLAILLFLWQVLIVAVHYLVISIWSPIRRMAHVFFIEEWEILMGAAAIDFWLMFLLLFNVSQAYRSAERQRGRCRGLGSAWLAGIASALIPGWGQIVNGQLKKGLFFLFGFLLQAYLLAYYLATPLYRIVSDLDPNQRLLREIINAGQIALGVTALLWLVSAYDAVLVARYTRNRAR